MGRDRFEQRLQRDRFLRHGGEIEVDRDKWLGTSSADEADTATSVMLGTQPTRLSGVRHWVQISARASTLDLVSSVQLLHQPAEDVVRTIEERDAVIANVMEPGEILAGRDEHHREHGRARRRGVRAARRAGDRSGLRAAAGRDRASGERFDRGPRGSTADCRPAADPATSDASDGRRRPRMWNTRPATPAATMCPHHPMASPARRRVPRSHRA